MQDTVKINFIAAFINDNFETIPTDYDQGFAHGLSSLQIHIAGPNYVCRLYRSKWATHLWRDSRVWPLWGFVAGHDLGVAKDVNRSGDSDSLTSTVSSLRLEQNYVLRSKIQRLYLTCINFDRSYVVNFKDSLKDVFQPWNTMSIYSRLMLQWSLMTTTTARDR